MAAAELDLRRLPSRYSKGLPRYPVPVLRLARLGVDRREQGKGIGLDLLKFGLELALRMADWFGCVGLVVDAKPPAIRFYEQYGFVRADAEDGQLASDDEPVPMFLHLDGIPAER